MSSKSSGEERLELVEFALQCRINPAKGIQCRVFKLQPTEHVEVIEQEERDKSKPGSECRPKKDGDTVADEDKTDEVISCLEQQQEQLEEAEDDEEEVEENPDEDE